MDILTFALAFSVGLAAAGIEAPPAEADSVRAPAASSRSPVAPARCGT